MLRTTIALCVFAGLLRPASPLTEQEAVRLALARNLSLQAARQGHTAALSKAAAAALRPGPQLRFGISDVDTDSGWSFRRENNVALRYSPPRPGELALKRAEAETEAREVAAAVATSEQTLAAEVRLVHRTILLLNEQISIAEESVRVREQILRAVEAQVEAGLKSALDRSAAELSLAEARTVPDQYRVERRIQMRRLEAKLGISESGTLELRGEGSPLDPGQPPLERTALLQAAFTRRPELDANQARCERAEIGLRAARRERYPWFSHVQVSRRFKVGDPSTWGFQVAIDLPVFTWWGLTTRPGNAELEQCRLQRQAAKVSIAAEVDEILLRMEAARNELAYYHEKMQALARRGVEEANAATDAGESDLVEPLLAEVRQLSARQAYCNRLIELRGLEIGLEQAIGQAAGDAATAAPAQTSSSKPAPRPYTASE